MKSIILVVAVFYLAFSQGKIQRSDEVLGSVSGVDVQPGERLRAYQVDWFPDQISQARIIRVLGVQLQKTGNYSGELDVVSFVMNSLFASALHFGYYHAEAELKNPDTSDGKIDVSQAGFAFWMRFFHIIEYEDNDSNPGFNPLSTDRIVSSYDLSNLLLPWKAPNITNTNLTTTNGTFKVFAIEMETKDEVFFFRLVASGHPADVNGIKITPDSIKVDIAIRYFDNDKIISSNPLLYKAYTQGPSDPVANPNTKLALSSAFAAQAGEIKSTLGTDSDNAIPTGKPVVQTKFGEYLGFFSWETEANIIVSGATVGQAGAVHVNYAEKDANITKNFESDIKAGWTFKLAYFSFDGKRPSEVYWDPEMGAQIDYEPNAGVALSKTLVFVASFVLAFVRAF